MKMWYKSFFTQLWLSFCLLLFCSLSSYGVDKQNNPRSAWLQYGKLRVSENGRYLVHEDETPFLWLGGTVWGMSEWLTREDVDYYLDNRKEKGVNVIQICLLWGKRHDHPGCDSTQMRQTHTDTGRCCIPTVSRTRPNPIQLPEVRPRRRMIIGTMLNTFSRQRKNGGCISPHCLCGEDVM